MDYEKNYETWDNGKGDFVHLEILPRKIKKIEINIEDVRASDGIQVKYDLDRDGWVILQPKDSNDAETWHEVGFFQSWALEEKSFEEIREGYQVVPSMKIEECVQLPDKAKS
jgi:hypothetical protein